MDMKEWGIKGLLQRISGDFAFAIWDQKKDVLSLARDRIGVKPLYFFIARKALRSLPQKLRPFSLILNVEADIDPSAMYHYLSFLTTPAPMTMFKGIFKIPGWSMHPNHGIRRVAGRTIIGMRSLVRESIRLIIAGLSEVLESISNI